MNEPMSNLDESSRAGALHSRVSYYHPNARGTGSAVNFELHPAHGATGGSIFATFARQKSVGGVVGGQRQFASFDWPNRVCVKFDITDISHLLEVFHGMAESVAEGKGLFHLSESGTLRILFRHLVDPLPGYHLEVERKDRTTGEERRVLFFVNPAEACGLCEVFAAAIPLVAFGVPEADA